MVWLAVSSTLLALTYKAMPVQAGDVTSRKITMASSEENLETNYDIDFTIPAGTTVGAILIEFCDNNPIPNTACVFNAVGDDIPQVDSSAGNIATEDGTDVATLSGGMTTCTDISLTAPGAGSQFLLLTCDVAEAFAGSVTFHAQINDIDNPSNATDSPTNPNAGFYARAYVYSVINPTPPTIGTGEVASPTNQVHNGGIALSTAEQLTITARVQEVLEFCVGDTSTVAATGDDCTDISGNDIDMGVLNFSALNTASVEDSNGFAMVRTNAVSGVVVDYFANNGNGNDNGDAGTEVDGHLAVSGQNCDFAATATDQCINSVGTTAAALTAGTENFGMAATSVSTVGGGLTTNLTRDVQYDYTGANEFAFDGTGATDRLASSASVVDDEMLVLDWQGTAQITTPTGIYSTVLTFIATPTF
jgi:hypothetical protein